MGRLQQVALQVAVLLLALAPAFSFRPVPVRVPAARRLQASPSWPEEIKISGVALGTVDGLRGIVASRDCGGDLVKSDPLVTVPGNLVFEVTNTRPPTPFPAFVSQSLWEDSLWDQRLAFKLLHELKVVGLAKSDKAFWLEQLPKSYSTPLHWPDEVLTQETQYPALRDKVLRQKAEWKSFYDRWMSEKAPESVGTVTYQDYVQALECVNSRAFSGSYEGSNAGDRQSLLLFTGALTLAFPLLNFGTWEQSLSAAVAVGMSIVLKDFFFAKASGLKRYVVCPYVDMFNHKSTVSSDVSYNYFSNVFELRTEAFSKGQQVFISYGKQSNDRLMQFYGFCDCENPFDVYDFGQGILEVLLKFGDELPPIPSPGQGPERLKTIAAALRLTEVEDATVRGSKRDGAVLRADEVPVRFFRLAPQDQQAGAGAGGGGAGGGVEAVLKAAAIRRGEGDAGTIARFDSVTARAVRALYASPAEWQALIGADGKIGNLEKLGAPLGAQTEALLAQALRKLAKCELESKTTTIEQDLATLAQGKPSKGFKSPSSPAVGGGPPADPSGPFQDALFAAISFRIEKKRLLLEAVGQN